MKLESIEISIQVNNLNMNNKKKSINEFIYQNFQLLIGLKKI